MLAAHSLRKSYRGVEVVHGIDVTLRPGRVVGLVGHNGAGKSTTIKMLAGLVEPTSGTVDLDGMATTIPAARQRIGYLPEESPLYDEQTPIALLTFFGSLYDVPRAESRRRAEVILNRLGLTEKHWKKTLGRMSKGMRRKVAVARALLHEPDVLILDEPASGLDPGTSRELGQLIREQADGGRAVLLSAHNLVQVEEVCDEILIMDHGDAVAHGSLEELRDRWSEVRYRVVASTMFDGATQRGSRFVGELDSLESVEATLAHVRHAGGDVLEVAYEPARLDEILQRVTRQ